MMPSGASPSRGGLTLTTLPLLLLSALYFAIGSNLGMSHYDEGLMAVGAWRVANGEVPYRDFWAMYPPGQYYVLAFLYHFFGPSLLLGRLYGVAMRLAAVTLGSHLSGLLGGRKVSLQTWLLLTIWLGPSDLHLYPVAPATALGLLSCLLACWSLTKPEPHRVVMAGVAAGLTCLFRYDYGLYAFLAGTIVIWAGARAGHVPGAFRRWLLYAFGLAILVLPVAAALLAAAGPHVLYSQFVDFPLHTYARVRALPYPRPFPGLAEIAEVAGGFDGLLRLLAISLLVLRKILFYFPIVVLLAASAELWFAVQRQRHEPVPTEGPGIPRWSLLAALLVFYAGSLNTLRVRPDLEHMEAPIAVALVLAPMLLSTVGRRIRPLGLALVVATAAVGVQGLLSRVVKETARSENGPARLSQLPRARGMWLLAESDRSLEDAIVFLRAEVPPGAPVFAGNKRHDCILFNDALFYLLVERPPATRYHELHPGIATTEPVQREIVRELELRRVSHVVLFDGGVSTEPNDSSRVPGSHLLDEFIRERFRPIRQFGPYSVWEANQSFESGRARSPETVVPKLPGDSS